MAQDPRVHFDSLVPSEKRRLYAAAMRRAQRVREIQVINWIEPHEDDWLLPFVLHHFEEMMTPATRAEAQEALGYVVRVMACKQPSEFVCESYLSIMTRYPRKLLMPSLAGAVARERYHVLPTVGALVADAEAEWQRRRALITDLKIAINRLELMRYFRQPTCR